MPPATTAEPAPTLPPGARHTPAEDAYSLLVGTALIAFGVVLLHRAGLVTGGFTGIALLVSYHVAMDAGTLFVLLNIPFYLLAWATMGRGFALKTVGVSLLVGVMAGFMPKLAAVGAVDAWFAAIFGGTIIGTGILALARHRASVGGVGVLALYLQDRRGWRAGWTQMAADGCIVLASLFGLEPGRALPSIASVIAVNLLLAINHKPGRYMGY